MEGLAAIVTLCVFDNVFVTVCTILCVLMSVGPGSV